MLTFDFICISVLKSTPDAKVFFNFTRREFSLSVAQLWLWSAHRGDGLSIAGGHQVDSGKCGFFSSGQPCGAFVVPRQNWKGSFRVFFIFLNVFFSFLVILCAERVRLWRFYVYAFCCADRTESISLCENYLFICLFLPRPSTSPPPTKRTFDSSVFSAMLWRASEAENGFNTTRAGVWTLLIDELRFIATTVAA